MRGIKWVGKDIMNRPKVVHNDKLKVCQPRVLSNFVH